MTTANKITMIRMVLVPVFMALLVNFSDLMWGKITALVIFIVASATDSLDGYIARKYNQITNFGKFADPLADKLLVCAALVGLCNLGLINSWIVFVILAREFIITGFRGVAVEAGIVIAAGMSGKIKTCVQIAAISLLLFNRIVEINAVGILAEITVWLALIMTIYSGCEYIIKNKEVIK